MGVNLVGKTEYRFLCQIPCTGTFMLFTKVLVKLTIVVKRHSFLEQEQMKLVKKRLEEQVEGPQKQFPVAEKVEKDFCFLRTITNCRQSHLWLLLITKKLDSFYQ